METQYPQSSEPRPGDAAAGSNTGDNSPIGASSSLEERLVKAEEDARKFRENWHRAEADFQNYKRRTEQERDETRKFANVSVIINLLPILDDFERAFGSLDSRLAGLSWFDGIYLIYRKLGQLLENSGVTPVQAEGQDFDPRFHEAVAHVEGEDGKVISEVQRGYKLHDRVLRPAMVVVGKGNPGEPGGTVQQPGPEQTTEPDQSNGHTEQTGGQEDQSQTQSQ
jgi:molecular chaperone GrpE